MITQPINKILFFDIETVGLFRNYEELEKNNEMLFKQFHNYFDWFLKRFPEDKELPKEQVFINRAALVPEFSKIVCASFAFVTPDGKVHKQTISGDDEKQTLFEINQLFNKVQKSDFWLCGHNVKNFDIPHLLKRMVINGIRPSTLLPSYETKPWEIRAIDTMDVWKFGNPFGLSSLELMCAAMGVPSSKEGEITGNRVHEAYWEHNQLNLIVEYCERDVLVLVDLIKKLKELK
jgi:predicted PolB exonuclease-like 3'-5' exonuclease